MTVANKDDARTLVWLREDLRCADNPALHHAAEAGGVLPVYILDTTNTRPLGAASKVWLYYSLKNLQKSIPVRVFKGDPKDIIPKLVQEHNLTGVYWNKGYTPGGIKRDEALKSALKSEEIDARSFKSILLVEPWEVSPKTSDFYKVFTPFWKACLKQFEQTPPTPPLPTPKATYIDATGESLEALGLRPANKTWHEAMINHWQVGEEAAMSKLKDFCQNTMADYQKGRNRPDKPGTSTLSPHLHFGEVSPRQVYHEAVKATERKQSRADGGDVFLSEIGWREFSYNLIYNIPTLPDDPMQEKFANFKWENNPEALKKWQQGQTGYPIVDAGMRQLWHTGWMHNRVRMITASFLIKDLLIHWKEGEKWFWDTLVDADMASNVAGWQWVAGCGADASPFFRIFNPVTQGQKFDPDGDYVRKWLPELADLPKKHIHAPWEASSGDLTLAGVKLGKDYPEPIVNHKTAREEALERYKSIKTA